VYSHTWRIKKEGKGGKGGGEYFITKTKFAANPKPSNVTAAH